MVFIPDQASTKYDIGDHAGDGILLDFGFSRIGSDPQQAAEVMSQILTDPQNGLVKQIHDASSAIYQLATNMLRNTDEYRSIKGGSQNTLKSKPMDYVNQVSDDYGELYKEYQKLFVTVGGENVTGTAFAEGKKITSKMLKKLFKETLKK